MNAHYITTPIYYANDRPHIGHAYTTIAADAIARYHRQRGDDVFLLTGTDEHGGNIERIAAAHGLTPQEHVDDIARSFRDLWAELDIQYDRFIRTTESGHRTAVLALWQRLQASGDLYRATYTGPYCPRCEAYYQLEELNAGSCPVHALPCEQLSEENWFFRLSRYRDALERLVRDTDFVQPTTRRNEVLGQLAAGLTDFSVSRRQAQWGIAVPDQSDEVIYVWVDALANYLTGVGFPDGRATFERYWPPELHLIGKEIIRFHCLYWPALLLSAGLPLPARIFAHGWLTSGGNKISKTARNGIDTRALVAEFGSDAVRYYFLRSVPFGQDGDYTRRAFVARYNAELANGFGNLVQRATTLAYRYGGESPPSELSATPLEVALRESAHTLEQRVEQAFETLALHEALAAVGEFVREANRYLEATAPWTLAKQGEIHRLAIVLHHVVEAARVAAQYYSPFVPQAAAEAQRRLSSSPPTVGEPLFPRHAEA